LIIQYVEFRSQIAERNSFGTKINDRLFDQQGFHLCDGVIPISDYLQAHIAQRSNNKMPQLKIPAICDFTEFNQYPTAPEQNYLMYCGTVHYLEVIYFILDFYKKIKEQNIYTGKLILVVSGDVQSYWDEFRSHLDNFTYKADVEIRSKIPYSELVGLYKGADLLLIPLRNNIQDIARFPQKISEYTAAKRPFISTNVGEMRAYFQHLHNAILATEYDTDSYVKAFQEAVSKNLLNNIGEAGFQTGMQHFHYQSNCNRLTNFFESLN
jgi:glycosyltransferase involved in cell wall biosynthesis